MKPSPELPESPYPTRLLGLVGVAITSSYALVSWLLWRYRFIGSDAYDYWLDSLTWQTPFNRFHVPLYPFLLAAGRAISPSGLPPLALMMVIVGVFFIASLGLTYKLIRMVDARPAYALWGMLLFGLWPLVGLTYVANPVADLVAITWYLAALLTLLRGRLMWAAFWLALALLTHKVMWFFGLALIWAYIRQRPCVPRSRLLVAAVLILSPVTILWLAGAAYHNSATWLLTANINEEFSSEGTLPILGGLIGTALSGSWSDVFKVMLILSVLGLTGWIIYRSTKGKHPLKPYGLAISIPLIMLALLVNQKELWVVMRFSRLLVLPLMWLWATDPPQLRIEGRYLRLVGVMIILLLVTSQFAFTWYLLSRPG